MKYCYLHGHLHHRHHFKQSLRLFHYINPPSLLVLYVHECSTYNSRIKIATYYSQNYAGILGSGLFLDMIRGGYNKTTQLVVRAQTNSDFCIQIYSVMAVDQIFEYSFLHFQIIMMCTTCNT